MTNKEYQKEYREKNRDKIREYDRSRYQKLSDEQKQKRNKDSKTQYEKTKGKVAIRNRIRHLKITYNISPQQYLEKMIGQKNCCAICKKPEHRLLKTGDVKPLAVDHNHNTGEVRELLCNDCNALLGFAKEDIGVLKNAIDYLKNHS